MPDQLNLHCDIHCLNPEYQSAYWKDHSCETTLARLLNDILWPMGHKEITVMVALGLSAAFDTVDHEVIISVMEKRYRITGQALEWIKSYLADRQFKVCVNGKYSSVKTLNFSVPQGSCSGAKSLCWYASTLSEVIHQQVNLNAVTDDHMVHKSFKPDIEHLEHKCIKELKRCLLNIHNWMNGNRLKMNPMKTEFIKFNSKQQLKKC